MSKMAAGHPVSQSGGVGNTTLSKILEALAVLQDDVNKFKHDKGANASVGSEPGTADLRSGPPQAFGRAHDISASPLVNFLGLDHKM